MTPTTPMTMPAISPAESFEELAGEDVVGTVVCVVAVVDADDCVVEGLEGRPEAVDVVTVAKIIQLAWLSSVFCMCQNSPKTL
jgi:hypothetical protein